VLVHNHRRDAGWWRRR